MSLVGYPDYRVIDEAWWNEIPQAWSVVRLKDVGQLQGGSGFPHEHQDTLGEDLAFYKVADLARSVDGITMGEGQHTVSRHTASFLRAAVIPANTVLYAKIGAALLLNRRRLTNKECCIDNNLSAFIPKKELLDARFALYWLETVDFGKVVNPGAVPSLSEGDQAILRMALPPDQDQKAIVAFLNLETAKIDDLIAEQELLVGLLEEKRQAVISHAVTKGFDPTASMKDSGVDWLGDVPEQWEVKRIKYVTESLDQGWSPQCEGYPAEDPNTWGVLKVGCVNGGNFNPEENKTLPENLDPVPALSLRAGDVLISRANTRELVGSAAAVPADFPRLMLCDKLYRVRLIECEYLPRLLAYFLGSDAARGQIEIAAGGASSSMLNISQGAILDLSIPIPPLTEQHRILTFLGGELSLNEELTVESIRAIGLLKERRAALISAAVTGKIDVRGLVADASPMQEAAE